MSEEQVRRVLNINERFSKMPILKRLLGSGEVSVNKLAKIVSIATPRNQEILANQVRFLSARALETLARDEKINKNENGFLKLENSAQSVHMNTNPSYFEENASAQNLQITEIPKSQISNECNIRNLALDSLNLSKEVIEKLRELKNKGIDINKLLLELLQERELKIAQDKERLSAKIIADGSANSRYIPVAIKKILRAEHGTKCSIATCHRETEVIHHSQRFSLHLCAKSTIKSRTVLM